jgi:hypothetical protein
MTSADVIHGQIPTVEDDSLEPEGIGAINLQQKEEEAEGDQKVAAPLGNGHRSAATARRSGGRSWGSLATGTRTNGRRRGGP